MTMCVSALALTSLDAVARIGRMSFQELFSVDDMEHAEGWRKLLCNVYFSTFITLVFGFILTKIGYANIWPLFGSANQLLSALVLSTLCVFLKVTGRSNKMLFPRRWSSCSASPSRLWCSVLWLWSRPSAMPLLSPSLPVKLPGALCSSPTACSSSLLSC